MCIALYISLKNSEISLWADELFSIVKTKPDMSLFNVIKNASLADSWPPLYYVLLHYIQILFGNSEIIIRSISIISNVLTIPILYLFTKELYSEKEALIACILLSISPFALSYSIEARGYSLFLFLSTLSFYLLIKLIKNDNNLYIYLHFIAIFLCSLTHYFGLLIAVFQLMFLFFNSRSKISKFIPIYFVLLLYPIIHFNNLYCKSHIFEHNYIFASDIQNRNYFILKELLPNLLLDINFTLESLILTAALSYAFIKLKNKSNQFVLFFMLAPIIFVNFFSYLFMNFLHARYFIFILPLVYIIIAFFTTRLFNKYYFIIFIFLLLLAAFNLNDVKLYKISADDRENVLFIQNQISKNMESNAVIVHSKLYYIDYYFNRFNIRIQKKTFFDDNELRSILSNELLKNNNIYILYPFIPKDTVILNLSEYFDIKKLNNKVYKIGKKVNCVSATLRRVLAHVP